MDNPFSYGGVVTGSSFTNRKKELHEITNDVMAGQNIFIYSPRRYGKTSLVKNVLNNIPDKKMVKIYVDFLQVYSRKRFVEIYSREIGKKMKTSFEGVINFFKKHISNVIPTVTLNDEDKPEFKLKYEESGKINDQLLSDMLELPSKLIKSQKKRAVIVFDEFQEISKLNGEAFENQLRSVIQHHENISYIFMGSKMHILLNMFNSKNRALYNIGKTLNLKKIERPEMISYIEKQFTKAKKIISAGVPEEICVLAKDHPYYIQMLCHQIWYESLAIDEIGKQTVDKAIEVLLANQNEFFSKMWGALSMHQKKFLVAISMSGGTGVFSAEYRNKNQLSAPSTVERSASKLVEDGVLEKNNGNYEYSDPFFQIWVKLNNK
ncbi:ATP-binding protein [bacterium]|nr:ATP-binding protein [bacterium]